MRPQNGGNTPPPCPEATQQPTTTPKTRRLVCHPLVVVVYHRRCSALLKAPTPMLRCGVCAKSQNAFTLYALKGFRCRIFDLMKSVCTKQIGSTGTGATQNGISNKSDHGGSCLRSRRTSTNELSEHLKIATPTTRTAKFCLSSAKSS
jgi:hypothetical protein